jgi:hypothetical protein
MPVTRPLVRLAAGMQRHIGMGDLSRVERFYGAATNRRCSARAGARVPSSKTIVRKICGGGDPSAHHFIIIAEMPTTDGHFVFAGTGVEMTVDEVCVALIAQGVSEGDASALIDEAIEAFHRAWSY